MGEVVISRGVAVFVFHALVACSSGSESAPSPTIHASDFDQACSSDGDCTFAYSGNVCGGCNCGGDPISFTGKDAYDAKLAELRKSCAPPQGDEVECGCRLTAKPVCSAGRCSFVKLR